MTDLASPVWRELAIGFAGAGLLVMQLVERRGSDYRLTPKRMVEIKTMLESIPDGAFLFDSEGRLVDCNRPAEELCGRKRQELDAITITELNRLLSARDEYDRAVETPSMGVNRALRGEIVRNVRRVFRHPIDGHVVETITSASPLRETSDRISGSLFIVRDISEVAQLQRRLAETQRHRDVGQMAAGLAHDFNNVLDTILQAAALIDLNEDRPAEERRAYTAMIGKAVQRGAEIIDRVRDYLRSGTGNQTQVDLQNLLYEVIDLTHPLWAAHKDIKVRTEIEKMPAVLAYASDLRRVFTNLIINALEAMPAGGELTIRTQRVGDRVRVLVSDTGQGIPPEQQPQLFVPYFTTKPQGTGLGLSGAQRIVNALHGNIRFRSEVGKGTTFVVELPVAASEQDARKSQQPEQKTA